MDSVNSFLLRIALVGFFGWVVVAVLLVTEQWQLIYPAWKLAVVFAVVALVVALTSKDKL